MARNFPPIPHGLAPSKIGNPDTVDEDVYDAMIDGIPHRWRCQSGTRKVVVHIEYAYDPKAEPDRRDPPWAKVWMNDAWYRKKQARISSINSMREVH